MARNGHWPTNHSEQNINRRLTEYGTSFARGTGLKDKWPRCRPPLSSVTSSRLFKELQDATSEATPRLA
jgi:hypothetical protein